MKKTYNIEGMHCVSCEVLINDNLKKIEGVKSCQVSHKNASASIEFESEAKDEEVKKAITESGYKLKEGPKEKDKTALYRNILQNILIFLSVGFILFFISRFDVSRLYPDLGTQVNYLVAIGLGFVASLSTCLALTGGIVMGFSAKLDIKENENPLLKRALPQVYFHIGRLIGFFILGGLLGVFGQAIGFSISTVTILTFAVAIVMFYLGLNIMGFVPSITSLGFHLPKGLATKIKKQEENEKPYMPLLLGVLTFFLPCGFTQSMQLSAVASGSFLGGGLLMFLFALGTMPVLFAVGFGSSFASGKKFKLVSKFIGAFIIFFGVWSFNNALVLAGSPITFIPASDKTELSQTPVKKINNGTQTVRLDIDYTFVQREITLVKGVPVVWEINPINITGCSNEVIIPSLGLSTGKLTKGKITTLEFTPNKTGVIPYSCWMGMITGRFVVVENDNTSSVSTSATCSSPEDLNTCQN